MQQETLTYSADGLTMKSQLFFEAGGGTRAGWRPQGLECSCFRRPTASTNTRWHAPRVWRAWGTWPWRATCTARPWSLKTSGNPSKCSMPSMPTLQRPGRGRAVGCAPSRLVPRWIAGVSVPSDFALEGTMGLELARSGAPIKAVVGFHSGLATVAPKTDAKAIKARILVCIGGDDPFIPPEQRVAFESEMRDAKVDWQMNLYGGTVHSFTNPRPPTPTDPTPFATVPPRTNDPGKRCGICLMKLLPSAPSAAMTQFARRSSIRTLRHDSRAEARFACRSAIRALKHDSRAKAPLFLLPSA